MDNIKLLEGLEKVGEPFNFGKSEKCDTTQMMTAYEYAIHNITRLIIESIESKKDKSMLYFRYGENYEISVKKVDATEEQLKKEGLIT